MTLFNNISVLMKVSLKEKKRKEKKRRKAGNTI